MDQSSQQCSQQSGRAKVLHLPRAADQRSEKVVVHFTVDPGTVSSWRVYADASLQFQGERIWLTFARSPYDVWLQPGNELRLRRGERVWLSAEGDVPAQIAVTTHLSGNRGWLSRWMTRLPALAFALIAPRVR